LVRGGRAVIAIRVFDHFGEGGINGTAPFRIRPADAKAGEEAIQLAGTWRLQVELALHCSPPSDIGIPAQFYNGMLHPLRGAAFDGILWYQGECDEADGAGYRHLQHAVVRQWRALFGKETPFFVVQLAGFREPPAEPGESWWAELRESQAKVLDLPRTALVAAHDLGEADDIHPRRKREVAERLAAVALHGFFGRPEIPASGPCFEALEPAGPGCLRVRFRHADGLRTRDGQARGGFQIAAADRIWHWADARIDGESVVVSHPEISEPVAVRYAWADNPAMANLENADGWPAFPFRTDRWPLSSGGI
jgi:sialate O-acetylesterase